MQADLLCRSCNATIYNVNDLSVLEPDKLIVRPEIASRRSATVVKRESDDNYNGNCPTCIYCRNCSSRLGAVQGDAVSDLLVHEISSKAVYVRELPEADWKTTLAFLRDNGATRVTLKELLKEGLSNEYSREGKPIHETRGVDMEDISDETLKALVTTNMRNYQMEMLRFALKQNSIVCLPTGSGKTLIAAAALRAMLHLNPEKIAAFVVNTNPLVEQQARALETEIPQVKTITFSGQMDEDLRRMHLKMIHKFEFDVLVVTCECLNRLVDMSILRPEDFCCLVLDEAHQTKGNSPYANLMKKIHGDVQPINKPLVVGMTASPLDTVSSKDTDASISLRIAELANELKCQPCYPIEFDPYDNGITRLKDEPLLIEPGKEEDDFRRSAEEYLKSVVSLVSVRLSNVASNFHGLEGLVRSPVNPFNTSRFRNMLRMIEKQLDQKKEMDLEKVHSTDICYGHAVRDHLNQILAVLEINTNIGHEFAMDRLKNIFDEIDQSAPGQESMKKEVLHR